ncbi:hypothetical protein JCM10207_008422 [Rhodosporidiobolus poonsookiae]
MLHFRRADMPPKTSVVPYSAFLREVQAFEDRALTVYNRDQVEKLVQEIHKMVRDDERWMELTELDFRVTDQPNTYQHVLIGMLRTGQERLENFEKMSRDVYLIINNALERELKHVQDGVHSYPPRHGNNSGLVQHAALLVQSVRSLAQRRVEHLDRVHLVFSNHQPFTIVQPTYFAVLVRELRRISLGLAQGIYTEETLADEKQHLSSLITVGLKLHENLHGVQGPAVPALASLGKGRFTPVARRLA